MLTGRIWGVPDALADDEEALDDSGARRMTRRMLARVCKARGDFVTAACITSLYLHDLKFRAIENLQEFTACKVLHLENNCLTRIEGLGHMPKLQTLYLQRNAISTLEGLEGLQQLTTLNVSNNPLRRLSGLPPSLLTLHAANTALGGVAGIASLASECPSLEVLDVSDNPLPASEPVLGALCSIKSLRVLYIIRTPLQQMPNLRRRLICGLPHLTYLDQRPADECERRGALAWAVGGAAAEQAARAAWREERRLAAKRATLVFAVERARRRALRELGAAGNEAAAAELALVMDDGYVEEEVRRRLGPGYGPGGPTLSPEDVDALPLVRYAGPKLPPNAAEDRGAPGGGAAAAAAAAAIPDRAGAEYGCSGSTAGPAPGMEVLGAQGAAADMAAVPQASGPATAQQANVTAAANAPPLGTAATRPAPGPDVEAAADPGSEASALELRASGTPYHAAQLHQPATTDAKQHATGKPNATAGLLADTLPTGHTVLAAGDAATRSYSGAGRVHAVYDLELPAAAPGPASAADLVPDHHQPQQQDAKSSSGPAPGPPDAAAGAAPPAAAAISVPAATGPGLPECVVCSDPFTEGELLTLLPCHHSFHSRCIRQWLTGFSNSCPMCRTPVLPLHPRRTTDSGAAHSPTLSPRGQPDALDHGHVPPATAASAAPHAAATAGSQGATATGCSTTGAPQQPAHVTDSNASACNGTASRGSEAAPCGLPCDRLEDAAAGSLLACKSLTPCAPGASMVAAQEPSTAEALHREPGAASPSLPSPTLTAADLDSDPQRMGTAPQGLGTAPQDLGTAPQGLGTTPQALFSAPAGGSAAAATVSARPPALPPCAHTQQGPEAAAEARAPAGEHGGLAGDGSTAALATGSDGAVDLGLGSEGAQPRASRCGSQGEALLLLGGLHAPEARRHVPQPQPPLPHIAAVGEVPLSGEGISSTTRRTDDAGDDSGDRDDEQGLQCHNHRQAAGGPYEPSESLPWSSVRRPSGAAAAGTVKELGESAALPPPAASAVSQHRHGAGAPSSASGVAAQPAARAPPGRPPPTQGAVGGFMARYSYRAPLPVPRGNVDEYEEQLWELPTGAQVAHVPYM